MNFFGKICFTLALLVMCSAGYDGGMILIENKHYYGLYIIQILTIFQVYTFGQIWEMI